MNMAMSRLWIALIFMAVVPFAQANPVDKSDLNGDGAVNDLDLQIFAGLYFEEPYETIDWCAFYETSMLDEKYFRRIVSDNIDRYKTLMSYIAVSYGCDAGDSSADKSDLNSDGVVDEADLAIFSTNYLAKNWEAVDWCLFYEITLAGDDFEGNPTNHYLADFTALLLFINYYYDCNAPEPPPSAILLESVPLAPYRFAAANDMSGDIFVSDPQVGSVFIYDQYLVPKAEIKGLNTPLGVAVDGQGRLLVADKRGPVGRVRRRYRPHAERHHPGCRWQHLCHRQSPRRGLGIHAFISADRLDRQSRRGPGGSEVPHRRRSLIDYPGDFRCRPG
jgi:hypothetical protein